MLKASALYLVIIISLVIGIICSALVAIAYYYRADYQKNIRYDHLANNLESGINILLGSRDTIAPKSLDLFGLDSDSIIISRKHWGVYDVGTCKAFTKGDTLSRAFSMAPRVDSASWAALYIIDEDRPLSVSGSTAITGDAWLPKAGVREEYINNKAYQGPRPIISGKQHNSERTLPSLMQARLNGIKQYLSPSTNKVQLAVIGDSVNQSFLGAERTFHLGKNVYTLQRTRIKGQVIVQSDTTLTIDSTARLDNVLVFAPSIKVGHGFQGRCELIATDSIIVEPHCTFNYPTAIGLLDYSNNKVSTPKKIVLGESSIINGIVFLYQQTGTELKPYVLLKKDVVVNGEVYVPGNIEYKAGVIINGSVFAGRFIYRSDYTLYQNYLIDLKLNSSGLSRYYLTSELLPAGNSKKNKILQWLENN